MIINNHKNFSDRLSIDYQYQSINWYRLSSIVIDCHRLSISSIVQVLICGGSKPSNKGGPASRKIFLGPFGPQFGLKISGGLPCIRNCFNKGPRLMKRFCFYFLLPVFLLINYFIHYYFVIENVVFSSVEQKVPKWITIFYNFYHFENVYAL